MAQELFAFYGLTTASAGCAAMAVYPLVSTVWLRSARGVERYQQVKVAKASKALDDLFMEVRPQRLKAIYGLGPLAAGILAYLVSNNLLLSAIAAITGMVVPDLWVRYTRAVRVRRFRVQLVDVLFILSSSLRAGLSLPQAFEQVESEMAPPASQEFGLMMKAYRLGRPLREALEGLNARIPCEELQLISTAILVSQETGGDITGVISQLITTIRERRKFQEKVMTLTLQGRLQAYLMSVLPIGFAAFVRSVSPEYFNVLLTEVQGRLLLAAAIGLWLIGMTLLMKMSRVEV